MKNKRILLSAFFIITVTLFASFAYAQSPNNSSEISDLPIGLQKIIEHNKEQASDFAIKISFFIAFVAGMLGILSPCILPFLPAYFAYTFKEKKDITKMTLVFFFGFTLVFVGMGIIAGFIGEQSLAVLQKSWLVSIAGLFFIAVGIMSLAGKNFFSFSFDHKFKNDLPGIFLLGIFFAIGWTACLGPILAGILGMGVMLGNVWYAGILMLFYSFGTIVPLFILSILYDKYDLSKNRFIKGKILEFSIDKKTYKIHSTNIISGILFLVIGIVLIIYKGTSVFNAWDIFGTRQYFYSIQNKLIAWEHANLFGIIIFLLFVVILIRFLQKYKSKNNSK